MNNNDQRALIEKTEALLQHHIRENITDELVFHGFKSTITPDGPRIQLFVNVRAEDGDDSFAAFHEANGIEETLNFLERLGLTEDMRIRYTF